MKKTLFKSIAVFVTLMILLNVFSSTTFFYAQENPKFISDYKKGDLFDFGWYPQTQVTDLALLSDLNRLAGSDKEWDSFDFYSGTGNVSDGNMVSGKWMRYKDISFNSCKYRGVVIDAFRPYYTGGNHEDTSTYQDSNGYFPNSIIWFRFDPLKWIVLDPNEGLLICKNVVDSQAFNNYIINDGVDEYGRPAYYGDKNKLFFANNYSESDIRQWLNNEFYNTVFSISQQKIIETSLLDNCSYSNDTSAYDSEKTQDKVFLLSYEDAINSKYFNSDNARITQGTDYAKCLGLGTLPKNSYWRLRTAGFNSSFSCVVNWAGKVYSDIFYTYYTHDGIRPSIKIKVDSEIIQSSVEEVGVGIYSGCVCKKHNYEDIITESTCYSQGYTTHTCSACGDSYVDSYVNALGHDFSNWTETKAATCTEKGEERRDCSRCDAFETREINAKGHSYNDVVTAPTCIAKGYTTHTCSACHDSFVDSYVDALGHDYKAVVTKPTCTEQGYTTYTCSRCNDSYKADYVPAKGHTDGEWKVTKQPTLTSEGIRTLYCSVCEKVIRTESIPKLTQGRVHSVKIDDVSLNYKKSTTLKPAIKADNGVKYTVKYESSNPKVATVDQNGNVTATKRGSGSATITCTVTDQYGNVVKDTCKVNVSLTFGQKIIVYVLFGWIWY